MSIAKISAPSLFRSRLADSVEVVEGPRIETPIVKMEVEEHEARSWRVTLGRPDRRDRRAPSVQGSTSGTSLPFRGSSFSYAASEQFTPAAPPLRDNPIARGTLLPQSDLDPIFVEIAWGMSSSMPTRLLAHWPMLGASIVLYGSYVEVFGGTFLLSGGNPLDSFPRLLAHVTPADGLAVAASGELSINQVTGISPVAPPPLGASAVFTTPDFAREVRVSLFDSDTGFPFAFGQPTAELIWWQDANSQPVEEWVQGTATGIEPRYQRVPALGTILQIFCPGPAAGQPAFEAVGVAVHWRIAP